MTTAELTSNGSHTAARGNAAREFVAAAERMTNASSLREALALFDDDCVAEWVFDGVYQRLHGIDEITPAMDAMMGVNRARKISGRKELVCTDGGTIVNTWRGGFGGDDRQFGTEIWTLKDGKVVHHQMFMYMRLRSAKSILGQLRMLALAPRTAVTWFKQERRAIREHRGAGARR